ncbi:MULTISPECIES: AAA family ATPase [unclassified Bradyrhizobium]|uniref:AAA family ATPase n=1 Tax=unclassified Bradyrhizobium TaxID=2631580 RepID=UPI0029163B73|nr:MULTISPECIES: AAA family ATPase [unclassified Bradyrhizobium]
MLHNDVLDVFRPGTPGRLRIGITGAPGVGKSTLTRRLSAFLGVPPVFEIARDFHDRGHTLGAGSSLETQLLMTMAQVAMESDLVQFVADRTIFDPLIHVDAVASYKSVPCPPLVVNCMANYLRKAHRYNYSHVFVLHHQSVRHADGVRETDHRYGELVYQRTLFWLNALGVRHSLIEGASEDQWLQVCKLLGCDAG